MKAFAWFFAISIGLLLPLRSTAQAVTKEDVLQAASQFF